MRRRTPLLSLFLTVASGGLLCASPPPPPLAGPPISGVVSHMERPIADALVVLYNLQESTLTRSHTATDGTFVMVSAPVGVYDLIAIKKGYRPALQRVWHQADPQRLSAVHIELASLAPDAKQKPVADNLWELRDQLPVDVLREIAFEAEAPAKTANNRLPSGSTVGGEVQAASDLAASESSLARTAVGLTGGLPNGWRYALHGDYSAVADHGNATADISTTTGNAAGVALDVATSPLDHLSLQTRRNTLSFHDDGPASLETHGVSWSRGVEEGTVESVAARYIEETNLYRATATGPASISPIASRTWEVRANYARPATDSPGVTVSMTYRHREGTTGPSGVSTDGTFLVSAPDADLSAAASTKLSSHAQVEGGVVARYLSGGYGLAPTATVRYDVGNQTAVFVKGLWRAKESGIGGGTTMPLVLSIDDRSDATATKAFAVGLQRNSDDGSFLVEVSSRRVGESVRAFFEGDFLTDFDSVYFFDGNMVRQYRASATHRLSNSVSGTVNAMYGTIGSDVAAPSAAAYGITSNSGHYWSARASVEIIPTHTGVAVLVRGARQTLETLAAPQANDSSKVAVSVSQDLSVVGLSPFGSAWRLLMALESARSTATGERDDALSTKRLLGGLAISF